VAFGCAGFVLAYPLAVVVTVTAGRPGPHKAWFLYEDVISRQTVGGTDEALARVRDEGFELEEAAFLLDGGLKRAAIAAYGSQVRGLGGLLDDAYAPERYWKMVCG
jgi:hypothetical protein